MTSLKIELAKDGSVEAVNDVIRSLKAALAGFDTYPKTVDETTKELCFLGRNSEEYSQFVGILIQNRLNAL